MFEIWLAMALATTIMSWWSLYKPITEELADDHLIKTNPKTSFIVWSIATTICAPIVVPALIVPSYKDGFIEGFVAGAEEE